MKKIILLIFFITFLFKTEYLHSQKFNGYSHIAIEDIEYTDGSLDKYDLTSKIIKFFKKKGFNTIRLDEDFNYYGGELKTENDCEILSVEVTHDTPRVGYATKVYMRFYDCNADEIMKFSGSGMSFSAKGDVNGGLKKILKIVESRMGKYKFDPNRTPVYN